jgi:hypothetical protein
MYFSGRDDRNRSQTGFVDIDLKRPRQALAASDAPVLTIGRAGSFDDSGAMASWIIGREGEWYLYYIGWNPGGTVPFRNAIGLATSRDGGRTFTKYAQGPILDRDVIDPCFLASCCVMIEGGVWRMWYLSGVGWERAGEELRPRYHIKYAESGDGICWRRTGVVCIDFQSDDEYAISRPCVLKDGAVYRMWYSYRGAHYRIGYAESKDGIAWTRKDGEAGLDVSASGWDSEMVEYPFVFDHLGERYMLYNGNGYGKTGIGLAVLGGE